MNATKLRFASAAATSLLVLVPASRGEPVVPHPTLVSRAPLAGGNGSSYATDVSKNGRFIEFTSTANDLVAGDIEGHSDVFVFDRKTAKMERVSVNEAGDGSNADAFGTGISGDGRFVLFFSSAADLVDGVAPTSTQLFLRDRKKHVTSLVSKSSAGVMADAWIYSAGISPGGRYIAFTTAATNLTADASNGYYQTFVHDRKKGVTELVSVSFNGDLANEDNFGPCVSENGRYVFFKSDADNLVPVDQNHASDVFVRDRKLGTTLRAAFGVDGELAKGVVEYTISATGRYVLFLTDSQASEQSSTPHGAYVVDRKTDEVRSAFVVANNYPAGGCDGNSLAISRNGRYVAFNSYFTSIVSPDPSGSKRDVFLIDREASTARVMTLDAQGGGIDGDCTHVAMSQNGKFLAFASDASDLVSTPTLGNQQIYFVER